MGDTSATSAVGYNLYKATGLHGVLLEVAHVPCLKDRYALCPQLGCVQFGIIRSCSDLVTGKALACKSIAKVRLVSATDMRGVKLKIEVMTRLGGQPNVVASKPCTRTAIPCTSSWSSALVGSSSIACRSATASPSARESSMERQNTTGKL